MRRRSTRPRRRKKLADATTKSLDLELQLAQRRQAKTPNADPTTVLKQDEVIRELERRTLEAQRQQAQAQKDLASKDEDIAKRRLELYQAQAAATGTQTLSSPGFHLNFGSSVWWRRRNSS